MKFKEFFLGTQAERDSLQGLKELSAAEGEGHLSYDQAVQRDTHSVNWLRDKISLDLKKMLNTENSFNG